jgi:2-(1,2-epoxy-1,2-dihydrophenyl)acetyl-CoA isomerase
MNYSTIDFEKKGTTGILSLNRPDKLNALSAEMKIELQECLTQAARDDGVRALILTGKGRAFSAGGDLHAFKHAYEAYRQNGAEDGFTDPALPRAFIDFPKPMIAAVNGPAVGFGLTVTLTCDIRIASERARFVCAFVRIGVTPEFGSSYFLPRLIGYGRAAELAMTARPIDADEALRIGLVNRVVAEEALMGDALDTAERIAKFPPASVRAVKTLMRHGMQSTLEQVIDYEELAFRHLMQKKEHYEAVCATIDEIGRGKKKLRSRNMNKRFYM